MCLSLQLKFFECGDRPKHNISAKSVVCVKKRIEDRPITDKKNWDWQ
jgi:hypothetical protein